MDTDFSAEQWGRLTISVANLLSRRGIVDDEGIDLLMLAAGVDGDGARQGLKVVASLLKRAAQTDPALREVVREGLLLRGIPEREVSDAIGIVAGTSRHSTIGSEAPGASSSPLIPTGTGPLFEQPTSAAPAGSTTTIDASDADEEHNQMRLTDIGIGPNGVLYMLDAGGGLLRVLTSDLRTIQAIDIGINFGITNPTSMAISRDGSVYITAVIDWTNSVVYQFSPDFEPQGHWTVPSLVTSLAIDSKRRVYAAMPMQGTIGVWDINRRGHPENMTDLEDRLSKELGTWKVADEVGHPLGPSCVAVDSDDDVWITTREGLSRATRKAKVDISWNGPVDAGGIDVRYDIVCVSDSTENRLLLYLLREQRVRIVEPGDGGLHGPGAVAVGSDGIYVLELGRLCRVNLIEEEFRIDAVWAL